MSSAPSSSRYTRAWLRPNSPVPTTATRVLFDCPAALILRSFPSKRYLVPARRAEGKPESRFPLHPPIRSILRGQKKSSPGIYCESGRTRIPHLFDGGQADHRYIKTHILAWLADLNYNQRLS